MIQMYSTPGYKICHHVGKQFVNDRLIRLVEDVITDYAQMQDESYMERITCRADWDKPLEEIIDLNRLVTDQTFASDCLMALLPDAFSRFPSAPTQALNIFFSLYQLLKSRNEYKPDLYMEYMLIQIIYAELDLCKDEVPPHKQIQRIPEPERSKMLQELIAGCSDEVSDDGTPEEYAEELMVYYEDLEEYIMTCFEDTDCLLLDEMTPEAMMESGFADRFGVHIFGDTRKMSLESNDGVRIDFDFSPWIGEDKD